MDSEAELIWDPNTWTLVPEWRRIWDPHIQHAAIVDEEDYDYLAQWKWNIKLYRGRPYMRRACGNRVYGPGGVYTIYLHLEVAARAALNSPSRHHTFIDHINHNPLDNRRVNLRWVTRRQNAENIRGKPFWEINRDQRQISGQLPAQSISGRASRLVLER
jgi:hypothetical protein